MLTVLYCADSADPVQPLITARPGKNPRHLRLRRQLVQNACRQRWPATWSTLGPALTEIHAGMLLLHQASFNCVASRAVANGAASGPYLGFWIGQTGREPAS